MERIRLTNQRIEKASCPAGKSQGFLWDDHVPRLALRVTKAGAKSFIYEGKLNRRTVRVTIGDPVNWTVDDARKEARRLQTLVDRGIDPREQKRQQREAREAAKKKAKWGKDKTLAALMALYADHCEGQGKVRHAKDVRSASKCHLVGADTDLANKPAKDVTPREIASLVRRVKEAGKLRMAGIFRSYLAAAYSCARKSPLSADLPATFIDFDIESNPVDPVPAIPVEARNRTLTKDEIKAYLGALKPDDTIDALLKLAVYTGGQRMAQLLRAEVKHWNPDEKILTLFDPKGNRKTPREHIVPLGQVGASIMEGLVEKTKQRESHLLFPSKAGTPIHGSNPGKRVSEISQEMEGESFNLLDIRRTVETMLAGLGINRDIRAQLLSHGISGVQAVHYDKHDYLREKRTAIQKWEAHLKRLIQGEERKVISLHG